VKRLIGALLPCDSVYLVGGFEPMTSANGRLSRNSENRYLAADDFRRPPQLEAVEGDADPPRRRAAGPGRARPRAPAPDRAPADRRSQEGQPMAEIVTVPTRSAPHLPPETRSSIWRPSPATMPSQPTRSKISSRDGRSSRPRSSLCWRPCCLTVTLFSTPPSTG
jgi:hypothetical protein